MILSCLCSLRLCFVAILQRIGLTSQNIDIDDSTSHAIASQPDETPTVASSSGSKEACLHEVFISFRGEDTRNKFVSHLHSALVDRGIRTYIDTENLKQGQTIKPELLKAIEESSIAIVVLSPNYGSSTWCLDELVKIMDCKKSGLYVFPIFYDIDPSDVRKQKNSFRQAFKDHEKNFKGDAEKVKNWREALEEIAGLVGKDIREKNELDCIKNIVDEILRRLPVKASQFRKSLVGIESFISEVKKLMYSKSNEVLFIGLWGMGGIGKTTTARAIFEDCKNKFGGSCFLGDVKQSNNKLKELQEKLLTSVLKIKYEGICDVVEGSSIIQERLQFQKVLIVIDDVDDIEQLNALANQCDWFGRGSVIIITTRDVHLLRDDHINKYDIQTLPEEEALLLFCHHAFKNDHPPKDYKDLSLQVLKYAGGLPLALKVFGDHLHGGVISFWKGMLSRLKVEPENKIIYKLQISFDGLSILQQNLFLNIACFFRGGFEYFVRKQLQSLGLHPEEGIDVLVRKSLIFINVGHFDEMHIEMHDLLQELGWYVVRQRAHGDVRRYNQLWLRKDIVEVLSNTTVSSEVEGIYTRRGRRDGLPRLGWETAFRQMDKLRFFQLPGELFEEKCDVDGLQIQSSPSQLYNPNLRWFSLRHYPGQSLPQGFRPMNLVHLSLQYSVIEETPDFSHMPNLEELYLSWSWKLIHVHPSLGDHKKIKCVDLSYCSELADFPKMKKLESLEILILSHTNITEFPEMYGNLDSFRVLDLSETFINGLPTSIVGTATGLQNLKFHCGWPYREEFTSLEVLEGSFPGLVSLKITGSGIVRTLDFAYLPYLEKLDLSGSDKLAEVHESLGFHKRIKSINLANCWELVEFPRIIDMDSLEELDLSFTSLKSFPEMTGNVIRLMKLCLDSTKITNLPWWIGCAIGLEVISMTGCECLVTLPISLIGPQLRRVDISSGGLKYFMENIDEETAQAVELNSSHTKRAKHISTPFSILSEGMGQISALDINFEDCGSLEELPEPLLARVRSLTIKDCPSLASWIGFNLVDLLDRYQHLCKLELHQQYDIHDFRPAFSEWESVFNMLRRREESFTVYLPGSEIPSWFQYRFNSRSVTAFLPPLAEWDTNNLKGFVASGLGFDCHKRQGLHVFIKYIPITDIRDWKGQKERTLFKMNTFPHFFLTKEVSRWGFSLVYSEDIVNDDISVTEDENSGYSKFEVKIKQSKVGING